MCQENGQGNSLRDRECYNLCLDIMRIDLQRVINNPFAVYLAFFLGRNLPLRIGYPLCSFVGDWIAKRRLSNLVQTVRINQWVVRGANLEKEALDSAVRETLRNNIRDLYHLYYYAERPGATQQLIRLNPLAQELIERPEFAGRGLVIAGLHLSGFDLILQSICRQGLKAMVLTIPDPQGGRLIEYEMRKKTGMNLSPASLSTLRQAVRYLEQGGIVLTGMDRPIPNPKVHPRFFGYPASLPTHHISLALQAHVPVIIMAALYQAGGKYHILSSDPIEMEGDPNRGKEVLRNAENVLKQAETFLGLAPQQWNMPLPVWPELLGTMPN
jgi:phosphatidylinositol dimannoside acyltransferase